MKALICISLLLIYSVTSFSQYEQQGAIGETMASTFNLSVDKLTGTCFLVIKDGKQYFVTAAHLFQSSHKSGDVVSIQMLIQNQWRSFDANIYFHPNRNVDIALITLSENVSQVIELPEAFKQYNDSLKKIVQGGFALDTTFNVPGTEVFFYGFPLGNMGTEALGIKFPLLKKAIISGWVKHKGLDKLLLDGHNNLGFSGGPVARYNTQSKKMSIIGVISGYVPEPIDVQHKGDTLSVYENSGIIVCYGSRYIEDIFKAHKKDVR